MSVSLSLILACLWALAANVIAMTPSRDHHWRAAYGLMALGVPILIYVWVQNGIWVALLVLLAGMSILRWPVIYLGRWLRRQVGRGAEKE